MKHPLILILFVCCFGINHSANCQDATPSYETRYVELYNEGAAFYGEGDYNSAINSFTLGLEIIEENVGKENSNYALTLNFLALTSSALGNYDNALEMNLECHALFKKIVGQEHPDYAASLNNLAIIYSSIGQHDQALERFLECLALKEKIHGKEHHDYTIILSHLANKYS